MRVTDPQVLAFRPTKDKYAWTFGGAEPVARISPGTILELFTEDCFAGRVQGPGGDRHHGLLVRRDLRRNKLETIRGAGAGDGP